MKFRSFKSPSDFTQGEYKYDIVPINNNNNANLADFVRTRGGILFLTDTGNKVINIVNGVIFIITNEKLVFCFSDLLYRVTILYRLLHPNQ